jgi:hypothetical protein
VVFLEYNECDFPRHVERRPRLHWTTAQICRKFRPLLSGGMVERFIAPVLKTGDPQGSVGSNPTPSATLILNDLRRSQLIYRNEDRNISPTFHSIPLASENGAEQGKDAQQREERCHYSCQRWRQVRTALV